ncbi:MAG: hypothetical protein QOG88_1374 [Actinomycetota bacterium]|jgi:DUF4097 and DUF4098 domain-containing protein YvlB|nr:hypothetical protein [Actinomycetota bacterium]
MEPMTFETPGDLLVKINIASGTIRLDAADTTTTEVSIERVKDPKNLVVRLDPDAGGGHRLSIEQKGGKFGFSSGKDLVIAIRCPLGTRLEMASGSADLTAHGRLGGIDFRSGSGDVEFDDVDGAVSVKVGSGDLVGGAVGGDLTMNSASGDVRIASVAGTLSARSASGDMDVDAVDGSVTVTSVSGDVRLGSLLRGTTNIRSVSGDVEIGVAAGTKVFLDVRAASGDARSDLTSVDGQSGEGRPLELKVLTVSGDIRIRRAPARTPVHA